MLEDPFEPFSHLYKRGIAVGEANIKLDTMTFRWQDEVFEFPTAKVHAISTWNGYVYEAKVKKLRELKNG